MSRYEKYIESKLICPKCKCNNINITEHWKNIISYIQESGVININDGEMEHGEAYKLTAECVDCGHIWRVKSSQITDLIKLTHKPKL